jgi:hypothetical protein
MDTRLDTDSQSRLAADTMAEDTSSDRWVAVWWAACPWVVAWWAEEDVLEEEAWAWAVWLSVQVVVCLLVVFWAPLWLTEEMVEEMAETMEEVMAATMAAVMAATTGVVIWEETWVGVIWVAATNKPAS